MKTEMSSREASHDKMRIINAADNRPQEIIQLDYDDVEKSSDALMLACMKGNLNVVKRLVEHNAADFHNKTVGLTPVTVACLNNHLDVVKYVVQTGHVDVNLPDGNGCTPLIRACQRANVSVSKYLLDNINGLDVNIADCDDNTALHYAVWCNKDSNTPLRKACCENDKREVERLLYLSEHNINVQNNDGDTPLHVACRYGNSPIVETLMRAGADETITNDRRKSPSQVAEMAGHYELPRMLNRDSILQMIQERQIILKWCAVQRHILMERIKKCFQSIISLNQNRLKPVIHLAPQMQLNIEEDKKYRCIIN